MFWFILVLAIIGIIIYTTMKSDDAQSSSHSSQDSTSSSTSYSSHSETDTLEAQHIYYCLPHFCGAIHAIRQAHSYRDSHQGGVYAVTIKEDGTYNVYGFYDHDGDYGVYEALKNRGYLQYYGMRKVEDGVSYQIDGIKALEHGAWLPTAEQLGNEMKEYFGEEIVIKIYPKVQREDYSCVNFKFKDK